MSFVLAVAKPPEDIVPESIFESIAGCSKMAAWPHEDHQRPEYCPNLSFVGGWLLDSLKVVMARVKVVILRNILMYSKLILTSSERVRSRRQ
jgi:hypothetical protein